MKLIVLGSGTAVPHPRRSSSAYWLEASGGSVLLDCGPSAMHRMAEEICEWSALDAIWISHFHLDHCGGLAPFLFGTKYAPQTQDREKPLRIIGPAGLRGLIERFDAVNDYRLFRQPFPLEVVEVEPLEQFEMLPGLRAAVMKTPHTPESLALHVRDADDRTLVFSSDTGFSEPLSAFARHADFFILECSFVKDKPVRKHLELAEAIYLIRKAEARRTMLTHLYAEWDEVDFRKLVDEFLPDVEILEAVDGLTIDVFPSE
jgi:ribonuclease BN (tRNA processing enzyme)